jgi:hypothetical protein
MNIICSSAASGFKVERPAQEMGVVCSVLRVLGSRPERVKRNMAKLRLLCTETLLPGRAEVVSFCHADEQPAFVNVDVDVSPGAWETGTDVHVVFVFPAFGVFSDRVGSLIFSNGRGEVAEESAERVHVVPIGLSHMDARFIPAS